MANNITLMVMANLTGSRNDNARAEESIQHNSKLSQHETELLINKIHGAKAAVGGVTPKAPPKKQASAGISLSELASSKQQKHK